MSSHILGIRSCAEDSFKLLPLRRDGAMSHLVGDNCKVALAMLIETRAMKY